MPDDERQASDPFSGSDIRVLCLVLGEQLLLFVHLGEQEEDEHCSKQDHNDPGEVSPLVARQERSLRRVRDMARVLRILLRDVGRAAERLLERGRHREAVSAVREPYHARGYCFAMSAALPNDFWSAAWT